MIKISKRLEKVASYVKKNDVLLDVGTDHGLLPMYLVEKKIINKDSTPIFDSGRVYKAYNDVLFYKENQCKTNKEIMKVNYNARNLKNYGKILSLLTILEKHKRKIDKDINLENCSNLY